MAKSPGQVKIVEVGPRDGLQNEKTLLPTAIKVQFIRGLIAAGLKNIEVTSFVSAKWLPQLADAKEVAWALKDQTTTNLIALVPNLSGLDTALATPLRHIAVFTAASDTFNQKNIHCDTQTSLARIREVVEKAQEHRFCLRGYVSTAFYCPYEGKISHEKVATLVHELILMGVDEIVLGDTIGAARPHEVDQLLDFVLKACPADRLALHFHDTRGLALVNIMCALERGIRIFDSAAGGLGGCPYAPGAQGNVATEEVVYLLESLGFQTGVDLEKLMQTSLWLEEHLGKKLSSRLLQAGLPKT